MIKNLIIIIFGYVFTMGSIAIAVGVGVKAAIQSFISDIYKVSANGDKNDDE